MTETIPQENTYSLNDIYILGSEGFTYNIDNNVVASINFLTEKLGSQIFITSNVFLKEPKPITSPTLPPPGFKLQPKRRKGNKTAEVSADEWDTIRTFQPTKMEQKNGTDSTIDQIRLYLNKLTDKTFLDLREKIINYLDEIYSDNTLTADDSDKISCVIYDLSTTNKFYSKIFADLFAELANTYSPVKEIFESKYANIDEQYSNITYGDPDVNYDEFCNCNKVNEKRKALSMFLVNLAQNGYIKASEIVQLLSKLLNIVTQNQSNSEFKNQNNELVENIAILFDSTVLSMFEESTDNIGNTISVISNKITELSTYKSKDFKGLSNKSIFKFMDLAEV